MMADEAPFHSGEREAQRLAGAQIDRAPIRDHMPDQHRAFFAAQPLLLAAGMAADGTLAATILTGVPGFISSPDARTLRIETVPDSREPFRSLLRASARIGALGIDFATRRRNRVNGRVAAVSDAGFTLAVEQSFGNCAKYIQVRDLAAVPEATPQGDIEWQTGLDDASRTSIQSADTFFVASSSGPVDIPHGGVDISHRGGLPGFIGIDGNCLRIPDFAGNRYFNTLGNFLRHPEAALLVLDFATGDLLHLSGAVEVDWAAATGGVDRSWKIEVRSAWHRRGAVPYRWQFRKWGLGSLRLTE